jgi:hypothetical protein
MGEDGMRDRLPEEAPESIFRGKIGGARSEPHLQTGNARNAHQLSSYADAIERDQCFVGCPWTALKRFERLLV